MIKSARQATSTQQTGEAMSALNEKIDKYLTFGLAKEEYAIVITKVKEIIGIAHITEIPEMDDFIKGVINLRSNVIPIVDLRKRLNMQQIEFSEKSCIIIAEKDTEKGVTSFGFTVDFVSEVHKISDCQVEKPMLCKNKNGVISGIAKVENRIKIILDANRILINTASEKQ